MIARRATGAVVLAGALALAAAGCDDDEKDDRRRADPAPPTTPTELTSPSSDVDLVSPRRGATVGNDFTATVRLTDVEINPRAIGKPPKPGEGYLHFVLDGGKLDTKEHSGADPKLFLQLRSSGSYSPAIEPRIAYRDVPAGRHTLQVVLAKNDHTDAGPRDTVRFTVR